MMNLIQACAVVAQQRPANSLLVATMGAMFAFDRIELEAAGGDASRRPPGRISSVPLMGGAAGLGLGLALAMPERAVVVVDGDASLLLELGGLVTVATARPAHFLHVVIRNGTQFSGLGNLATLQPTLSFAGLAKEAGYAYTEVIDSAETWARRFPELLSQPGPTFVELMVEQVPPRTGPGFELPEMPDLQFSRMGQELAALQRWLETTT
jgi:phosphonopyruvate decarboxylase